MAYDATYKGKWSDAIVKSYRKRITQIESAVSRQDLYVLKSLRLEKLKGSRKDQHSMRINNQYRLIVRFDKEEKIEIVNILAVEDYH